MNSLGDSSPSLRGRGQGEGGACATLAVVPPAPPPPTPPRKGEGSARKWIRSVLTFAALLLFTVTPAAAQVPASWTAPFPPFRVIGNIYYVGSAGLSAWIVKTRKGLILLDVGTPANADMVENNIRTLGFRLHDVKILLNSHAHFDHAGGLAKLKADTGAEMVASAGDKDALEKGVYPGWEQNHVLDFPPVKVDRVIGDGDKVTLGGVTLTARITPGHTAGATAYLMPVTEAGVRHQVIFFPSASVAANRLAPNPQYPGIVADYRKTFARLKTIYADVYLAPHAEFFDLQAKRAAMGPGKPNPFVKPGEFQAAVATFEKDFDAALAKQEAAKP